MPKNPSTTRNLGLVVFVCLAFIGSEGVAQSNDSATENTPSERGSDPDSTEDLEVESGEPDREPETLSSETLPGKPIQTTLNIEGWSVQKTGQGEESSDLVATRGAWKIFADRLVESSGEAGPLILAGRVRIVGQGETGRVVVGGAKARVEGSVVELDTEVDQESPFMTRPDDAWTLHANTITVEVDTDAIRLDGVSGAQLNSDNSNDSKPYQATSNL